MKAISESMFGRDLLVLMAKEPRPGFSKTRLADGMGAGPAQELAEAFLLDTFGLVQSFAGARDDRDALVAFAPLDAEGWFRERCSPWASLVPQPAEDLGLRMLAALQHGFAGGAQRCVLLGTDSPHLPPGRLEEAFTALDDADVVVGPTVDGGYYLLGLGAVHADLFRGVEWSTSRVLGTTLERTRELGLTAVMLEQETDIDDVDDLAALRASLSGRSQRAPETARRLRNLGLDSPE